MEAPGLKLIAVDRSPREAERSPLPFVLGALLCAFTGLATLLGADVARESIEAREVAEDALQLALVRGADDAEVRESLVELRRTLGRRPLDARTRVVYASLLLGLSSTGEEIRLAAFHAGRAAELSPVTVSVIRSAALVLAHTGNLDESLRLIRRMFGYDPARAALLLSDVEARVLGVNVDEAIPDDPESYVAWARQLRIDDRGEDELQWLVRANERWPDYLPALEQLASKAYYRGDWPALEALFEAERSLPDDPAAAGPLLWRARVKVRHGDRSGALADLDRALALDGATGPNLMLAGDVYRSLGDIDRARHEWNRALHALGPEQQADRRSLLGRLARLEDAHGRPAVALRLWRELLELDPDHAEARRRVDDLSGFRR